MYTRPRARGRKQAGLANPGGKRWLRAAIGLLSRVPWPWRYYGRLRRFFSEVSNFEGSRPKKKKKKGSILERINFGSYEDNGLEHRKRLSKFWIMDWSRLLQTPNLDKRLDNQLWIITAYPIAYPIAYPTTSKLQTPNSKLQTPNSKLQTLIQSLIQLQHPNSKLQTPNSKLQLFNFFLFPWGDGASRRTAGAGAERMIRTCGRQADAAG